MSGDNTLAGVLRKRPNLVVFLTNFSIMTLELVAGRLIAPYVGVSLYTWTAVIGIVLAGITVGNYWGGNLADKNPSWRLVGMALLGAGVLALVSLNLIGFTGGGLVKAPLPYVVNVLLITLIFFFPSVLLGMVSPVVAKMTVLDLSKTGNTVGKIYAAAALGSIVGTYATGFWLISVFGVRAIILLVSVLLMVLSLPFLDLDRLRKESLRDKLVVASLLLVLLVGSGVLVYSKGCFRESNYYCIRVDFDQETGLKYMRLDHLIHSVSDMNSPETLDYDYEKLFAVFYDYFEVQPRVLFLGAGAYTLPRYLVHRYGEPQGTVVEIDPVVSEVAYAEFDMPRESSLQTVNVDGRIFLQHLEDEEKYDLVLGDAFSDFSIPYHLTTREFALMIDDHLSEDGIYAANVIDSLEPGLFLGSYLKTLDEVFDFTYLLKPTAEEFTEKDRMTLIIVSSHVELNEEKLKRAAIALGFSEQLAFVALDKVQDLTANAQILTDDFAPVDNLVAPVFAKS